MWGIDGGFPRHVIRDFSVRFGDTEVPVYRKYLRDLSNVVEASVVAGSRGASNTLVLHLRGGDAHGSFRAELTFTDCRLTERVVRMGEFPEQVWERTEVGHFEIEACGRTRR
jgi:hypothetical protein